MLGLASKSKKSSGSGVEDIYVSRIEGPPPLASWGSPESTSTHANASVTFTKPPPSASAVAVALAAAQLFVYHGSCRWSSWLGAAVATHASVVAATAVLALPNPFP